MKMGSPYLQNSQKVSRRLSEVEESSSSSSFSQISEGPNENENNDAKIVDENETEK